MGAIRFVTWSEFTVLTSCGKFFCFLVFCLWGSSSSSLGVSSPLCSALSFPDCLKTQQSLWCGWQASQEYCVSDIFCPGFCLSWNDHPYYLEGVVLSDFAVSF